MKKRPINDQVQWLGAVDWNRRLFDSLIPLPDGTSYNAYLVTGSEATALIDTADPSKGDILMTQLADVERIDYVVANLANALRPKLRWASVINSYGWSSQAVERIAAMIPNLKVEILAPVLCQGAPREKDFAALDALAETVAARHGELKS